MKFTLFIIALFSISVLSFSQKTIDLNIRNWDYEYQNFDDGSMIIIAKCFMPADKNIYYCDKDGNLVWEKIEKSTIGDWYFQETFDNAGAGFVYNYSIIDKREKKTYRLSTTKSKVVVSEVGLKTKVESQTVKTKAFSNSKFNPLPVYSSSDYISFIDDSGNVHWVIETGTDDKKDDKAEQYVCIIYNVKSKEINVNKIDYIHKGDSQHRLLGAHNGEPYFAEWESTIGGNSNIIISKINENHEVEEFIEINEALDSKIDLVNVSNVPTIDYDNNSFLLALTLKETANLGLEKGRSYKFLKIDDKSTYSIASYSLPEEIKASGDLPLKYTKLNESTDRILVYSDTKGLTFDLDFKKKEASNEMIFNLNGKYSIDLALKHDQLPEYLEDYYQELLDENDVYDNATLGEYPKNSPTLLLSEDTWHIVSILSIREKDPEKVLSERIKQIFIEIY